MAVAVAPAVAPVVVDIDNVGVVDLVVLVVEDEVEE